tara:strand:+ start:4306 stop:4581 length:276 start_codon:yes stop_codon:yes gene_type:complete
MKTLNESRVQLTPKQLTTCYERSLTMCLETCYIHKDLIFDFQVWYQRHCETCQEEREDYMYGYEQDSDQDLVNEYIQSKGREIIKEGFFGD